MRNLRPTCLRAWTWCWLIALVAAPAAAQEGDNFFTHGPILGRPTARSMGVWGRTLVPGKFVVKYGLTPAALDHTSPAVETTRQHDHTAWVELTDLQPDTRYYYELHLPDIGGHSGRSGTFRTLPDGEALRHAELNPRGLFNFRFEFACGNNQNPGHSSGPALPAFRTLLEKEADRLHFAILNGDWLYEARREYTVDQWRQQVELGAGELPRVVDVAPTIVGVWENYKHFLSQGRPLAEWHSRVPSLFTFDDHEILNDVWGTGTPGLRDRRAAFRDIGVQAWTDYLGWSNPTSFTAPIPFGRCQLQQGSNVLVDPQGGFDRLDLEQLTNLMIHWGGPTAGVNDNRLDVVGGDPNAGVYRIVRVLDGGRLEIDPPARATGGAAYSIGRRQYFRYRVANCDFFVLDTRGQRDMHDTTQPDKPGISMIGPEQRRWLFEGLQASDADFVFIVSSVNFMIPHVGGGAIREGNKDEAWTVFLDEREKLIDLCDRLRQPVFVLTGDLHNSFAIKITDNVWEFASGPHNSNNHWASDEGDRPANGPFQWGPRPCEIRWSTHFRRDIPRPNLLHPKYCVVQVNNVYNNPLELGQTRLVAYPQPQVIFQFYDGRTGELDYAESIVAPPPAAAGESSRRPR